MDAIFFDITIIICVAAFLAYIFRLLHQPAIIAYILTGVLLGPLGIIHLQSTSSLVSLGNVGITLLLFMLGLELQIKELASIGKTAGILALLQMWFTFFIGFFVSKLLGYENGTSFLIGAALTFSSTVILVKILAEKKDLNSLHGKLAIAISLIQDLVAVILLIFLSQSHHFLNPLFFTQQIGLLIIKIVLVFGVITFLSYRVFPFLTGYISSSSELVFLFSLAWMFLFTAIITSSFIGFSIEIGGFLAGLALANTNEHFQIVGRMKPLRDFFLTIFFVMLGLQMSFAHFFVLLPQALLLAFFALIIKPVIILFLTSLLGFRKRTSFMVSISLGQLSEFSFLLIFLASQLHYLSPDVVTILIVAGLISFAVSTYLVQNAGNVYKHIAPQLDWLEVKQSKSLHIEERSANELIKMDHHLVIIGAHQMGMSVLKSLEKDEQVIVVDFDPDVIARLKKNKINYLFGDIADTEIQERAQLGTAKLVISTIPDVEDNLSLIEYMNKENKRAKIVVMAYEARDAKRLYLAGADYVVLPHLAGGRHIAKLLKDEGLVDIEKYKKKDLEYLSI